MAIDFHETQGQEKAGLKMNAEFLAFLDTGLDPKDRDSAILDFHLSWWLSDQQPLSVKGILSLATLKVCIMLLCTTIMRKLS